MRKLKADLHGPILCFVGPPGVGKTSLGQSIAEAMGRKFERISVGGVRDEAEIRGHRRTYVGAMPGIIVRAMRDAGTNNPVFMIDEIDKTGADWRGDPASALLEVLDPEQNFSFRDHYLDLPFDLSKVMFITTANQLEPIPPPLRDRMEIIELAGYTIEEKLHIARTTWCRSRSRPTGSRRRMVSVRPTTPCARSSASYTREAGVRNLEREIGTVCRKLAREVAEHGERALARRRQEGARAARPAARLQRGQAAHHGRRRGHRAGLDAGRRRHPLHRGDAPCPAPASSPSPASSAT